MTETWTTRNGPLDCDDKPSDSTCYQTTLNSLYFGQLSRCHALDACVVLNYRSHGERHCTTGPIHPGQPPRGQSPPGKPPQRRAPEADLRGANLQGADLGEAELSAANLRGANLRTANLRGADLRNANHDGATRWPDGFDPRTIDVETPGELPDRALACRSHAAMIDWANSAPVPYQPPPRRAPILACRRSIWLST
jgi:hypothetical protein